MEEGQFRIVQLSDPTRGLEEQCYQCVSPAGGSWVCSCRSRRQGRGGKWGRMVWGSVEG